MSGLLRAGETFLGQTPWNWDPGFPAQMAGGLLQSSWGSLRGLSPKGDLPPEHVSAGVAKGQLFVEVWVGLRLQAG